MNLFNLTRKDVHADATVPLISLGTRLQEHLPYVFSPTPPHFNQSHPSIGCHLHDLVSVSHLTALFHCGAECDLVNDVILSVAGNCVGSLFAGPFCDLWGRRGAMFVGGFFILLGSAVVTSAQTAEAFIGGRVRRFFQTPLFGRASALIRCEVRPWFWYRHFYDCCSNMGY